MISTLVGALKRITVGGENGTNEVASDSEEEGNEGDIVIPKVKTGMTSSHSRGEEGEDGGTDADEIERIQTKGLITALDYDTGKAVIDRNYKVDIYKFDPRGTKIGRGSEVEFEAVRSRKHPQWKVVSLKLYETDKEKINKERMRFRNVIAQVVRVSSEFTEIEAGNPKAKNQSKLIKIPNTSETNVGFCWIPGDWMQLLLENVGNEEGAGDNDFYDMPECVMTSKILSIAPLQRKTVVGKVTKRHDNFLIDDTIYFTQDVCKSMFAIGAVVKCEAISSDQSLGFDRKDFVKWRAIDVVKSNFLHYTGMEAFGDGNGDWQVDEVGREAMNRHQELMLDKCGIKIAPKSINFSKLLIGTSVVKTFSIRNDSNEAVCLKKYRFSQDASVCQFEINCASKQDDGTVLIMPDDEVVFEVRCKPLMIGRTVEICVFDFGICMIARNFCVIGRAEEEESLIIDTSRGRPNFKKQIGDQDISIIIADKERKRIRGSQMVRAPFFSQKRLPLNKVPKDLFQIMKDQDERKLQMMFPHALDVLMFENYKEKFQVSLWFEEIENDLRRRQYDLHGVRLEKCGSHPVQFKFNAPGVQDFQPPVNIQDTIDAFDPGCETNAKFQGTIMKIIDNTVFCVFGEAFNEQYAGIPLTIQFNLGRTNYKRCHFAVQTAVEYLGERFLFPEPNFTVKPPRILLLDEGDDEDENHEAQAAESQNQEPGGSSETTSKASNESSVFRKHKPTGMFSANKTSAPSSTVAGDIVGRRVPSIRSHFVSDTPSAPSCSSARLEWFNHSLNEEQKDAVRRILRGNARPLPYIIYGPPGTGKTVTLVEAVMQVNKLDKNSRILVCAPSNAAADVIAEYLADSNQYHPGDFVRLNGFLRSGQALLESIEPYCTDGEDLNNVAMHRLIISTCMTAGQFFSLDLSIGHFTHVFVDEAGYCTEPETMVPTILLALSKGGQLILAGDPNQLGPVLMSDVSQNIGLNKSFLERLMTRKLYSRDEVKYPKEKYNPLVLTKLVKNYRAHPTLLKLPSRLFYDDDLEARASYEEAHQLCEDPAMKDVLVSEGVPLIFHGVQGQCSRERDSPSWCNKAEAITVVHYVATLLGRCGITKDDIGIITPYRKQVEKIRLALQMNLRYTEDELPKVASVEEFQGGERKIIIISTVRSANEERIENQLERLGFLYQPKRFNVVITRAKALLIVVGNPFVLSRNNFWLQLLRYALDLNAYKGCNTPIHLDRNIRSMIDHDRSANEDEEPAGAGADQSSTAVDEFEQVLQF